MTLYRITAPYFVAGVLVDHGRVVKAAPILGWTRGREWSEVEAWCARKGFGVAEVERESP